MEAELDAPKPERKPEELECGGISWIARKCEPSRRGRRGMLIVDVLGTVEITGEERNS